MGEDAGVLATDGHVMLRGVRYSARMLSFAASPQLYQSGVLLDEQRNPCFDQIPFEITQVCHTGMSHSFARVLLLVFGYCCMITQV